MQPQHPNCQHILRASLLTDRGRRGAFIVGASAVLRPPPDKTLMEYLGELLKKSGLSSPEEVRKLPALPAGRWIVRHVPAPEADFAENADQLLCAAILGLSSPSFYSPDRPLVWTHDRITRAVTLYRLGNFYAD
jgi:hypothetical protein